MLVLEAEAIEFEGRRGAVFETFDHRLAAAGIAAHRIDADGVVRGHHTGIHERPQQRHRAGRITAGVRDFSRRPDLVGLVGREFRKTIGPVAGDPKGRRRIQHLGAGSSHAVDQRDRLARGVIRQAEDDEVHLLHQRALRLRILALVLGNVPEHDVVLQAQPLANAKARGPGCAVDEHGGLRRGAGGQRLALRLHGLGKGHGVVLQSAETSRGVAVL